MLQPSLFLIQQVQVMRKCKQTTLKFGGWNIEGLHKRVNRKRINKVSQEDTLEKIKDLDIVLLIETHCSYKTLTRY